jgi:hypothetical protein
LGVSNGTVVVLDRWNSRSAGNATRRPKATSTIPTHQAIRIASAEEMRGRRRLKATPRR